MSHEPVLLQEVIAGLDLRAGLTVLDATLGGGGHSRVIGEAIGSAGRLVGLDADPTAIAAAKNQLSDLPCVKIFKVGNFRDLATHLDTLGIKRIDRAIFDLGLSSIQLADVSRGFSFQSDGPLLMTLDGTDTGELNAARLVNELSIQELTNLIARYGGERYARQIAEAIVTKRRRGAIITTGQLVEIIAAAVPRSYRSGRRHFATKTFQALRIAVNNELETLTLGLSSCWQYLAPQGRLAVISFHSLETRIIKELFRNWAKTSEGQLITKHAVKPGWTERQRNPRARSAILRIISKSI